MPSGAQLPRLSNGEPIALAEVPLLALEEFRETLVTQASGGTRLAALFGSSGADDAVRLFAVLADPLEGFLSPLCTDLTGDEYPALTPDCPQAHVFEREIAEQWGVVPRGHPWLKPVRYVHSF